MPELPEVETSVQAIQELKTQEMNKQLKPLQDQLSDEYAKMNDFNREYWNMSAEKNSYIKTSKKNRGTKMRKKKTHKRTKKNKKNKKNP